MEKWINSNKTLIGGLLTLACVQALPAAATPFSSVLPSSRSVVVGNVATAFATVINPDEEDAENCTIAPVTVVDADFFYQTTDPATNEATGTINTPVDIEAGGSQSFIFGLTPNSDFAAIPVEFAFTCSTGTAPSAIGINTLLLSGNTEPTADVVAVGLTPSRDGFSRIPRDGVFGLLSLATTNVGADATITAQPVDLGGLDGVILICETNQDTAECLDPPSASTSGPLEEDGTRTYSAFINANTRILPDATTRRVAVDFVDEFGNVRGSTSVAIEGGGPSAETFFVQNVADSIVQNECVECHVQGGTAGDTALVFELDEVPGFRETNFAIFADFLNEDSDNAEEVITEITGGDEDHPQIVTADSPVVSQLRVFFELFATEPSS